MSAHLSENAKHAVDAVSVVTVVGTLAEVLPAVAAMFTIIWTALRIWETETVQSIVRKVRKK
jgi:chromate transport protein ChrA